MKISFIGGGNMAMAMVSGMVSQGFKPNEIHIVEPDTNKRNALAQQFHVSTGAPEDPLPASTAVILAVKPQQLRTVAAAFAPQLTDSLVISIAAGIRADTLGKWLGGLDRIVRVMPNTPALVQAGISGAFAGSGATVDDKVLAKRILDSIGETIWVDKESDIDGVTAISGSGPAYVFYFIESLQAAAQAQGFTPEIARKLAYQTFAGAIKLALQSEDDAATLRQKVTSKGGTTERAIDTLENKQVREIIAAAVSAAAARSKELGEELGRDTSNRL